ncbi:MAG: HD domain-containing protein [Dehalococcoidia bacterium]|nr:HD domain-containing protein [Dehalococcoidia bacterium]
MLNIKARSFIGLVALAGAGSIIAGLLISPPPSESIWILVSLIVLCGVAQATSVPLFASSSVSLSFAVSFVSLLLLGPAGGILVNLGSAAVHAFYPKRRVWYKGVFNTGVFTISAACAGAVYFLAGGVWPVRDLVSGAVPAAAAAMAYFLVNTMLVSFAIALTSGTAFKTIFRENHSWLVLQYLTIGSIGLMAAVAYRTMGPPALVVFLVPLLMPWAATKMYVSQTRTVIARNTELVQVNEQLTKANANLQHRIDEMGTLYRVGLTLNRSLELQDMLSYIGNSVKDLTKAHGVAVFVNDKDHGRLTLTQQVGLSSDYVRQPELSLDGPAVRAIREGRRFFLDSVSINADLLSAAAVREGVVAAACLPLTIGSEVLGALDITFTHPHAFADNELTMLETFAEMTAGGIHSWRLHQQVHSSYLSTIAALVATVEAKDPYTKGHSDRVRDLSLSIGTQLGLSQDDLNILELASLFHDIGKIGIPENILGKDGALSDEEWKSIKCHPSIAETILKHIPRLKATIPIIRAHHERPDGRGYPDGLDGSMPKLSAIIGVADSYDAMTSNRPYRLAKSKEFAIAQLKEGAGSQFDPEIVTAALEILDPKLNPHPHLQVLQMAS